MPMKRTLQCLAASCCAAVAWSASAQPVIYTDLGPRLAPEELVIPIRLQSGDDRQWFRIEIAAATTDAGFLDIWTYPADLGGHFIRLPRVGLYDDFGNLVGVSDNLTEFQYAMLSFGLQDPRPAATMPPFLDEEPVSPGWPSKGQRGVLPAGTYWFVVTRGGAVSFNPNWFVGSAENPARMDRNTELHIRIQPPDIPYCDGDFNWDGNTDQDDVMYLANVLAGGDNPTGRWADYNRDGNEDQDDLLALVHTIAGGGCP
ncbi:MAG: hypothetical protein DYG92_14510 [Leptolyngbya sp. PLA1]|nr:hypothetical protein [Leptolyngbya sp. PLA1]